MQGFGPIASAPIAGAGVDPISASAAQTLATLSQSATGPGLIVQGAAAQTLAGVSQTAVAGSYVAAEAAQTLADVIQYASSTFDVRGAEALADLSQDATGMVLVSGTIATVFDGL